MPGILASIVAGIEEIKGEHISILDLRTIENAVCDFFVVCSAQSSTQVKAIADSVEKVVREVNDERPWHVEGLMHADWVLLDYVHTVVHVFRTETRAFYDLESLWGDALPLTPHPTVEG
ncbi:ribosome silencing factor [bacterium]|nr:ribosome silencing factor [bacterium]